MLSADAARIDFIVLAASKATPPHGLLQGDICLLCMVFVESACRVVIFFRFFGSFALLYVRTHACRERLCVTRRTGQPLFHGFCPTVITEIKRVNRSV